MPFIRPELIRLVLSHMHPPLLALFPCHGNTHLEPLCAAYHRDGLPVLESHILEGKSKVQWIFTGEQKGLVPEILLREADDDLKSFININSPEDARKAGGGGEFLVRENAVIGNKILPWVERQDKGKTSFQG
jgi:molybdopterin-guanine dinucleotide biosynthesis protein A